MLEVRDIQNPFAKWLDTEGIPFERSRSDKKTTSKNGTPDFLCCLASRCLYVECKLPGGKLSPAQEKRIAYLRKAGNTVKIAYSLPEAISAVRSHFGICDDSSAGWAHVGPAPETVAITHGLKETPTGNIVSTQKGSQADPVTRKEGDAHDTEILPVRHNRTGEVGAGQTFKPDAPALSEQERANSVVARGGEHAEGVASEWTAVIGGVPWVCAGDPNPGGLFKRVRRATGWECLNLKRQ